jgi:hypothetical protein
VVLQHILGHLGLQLVGLNNPSALSAILDLAVRHDGLSKGSAMEHSDQSLKVVFLPALQLGWMLRSTEDEEQVLESH